MRSLFTAGVARPEGFEPPAFRIGICCSIQLGYGRILLTVDIISHIKLLSNIKKY